MTGRVLYLGDPRGALALLARGVPLAGVVHGRRGGPGARRLAPMLGGVPRWMTPDLQDADVVAALAALRPALIVSGFYPRRIPRTVLGLAPGLNVHPSDLPRWRGPDPCHWVIRAGDTQTALCVHWLSEGLDEGDVLARERHAVRPRETAGALAERMEARGATLLAEVAEAVLGGTSLPASPQEGEVTWAPLVPEDALEIDWTRDAEEVDRLVRAAAPDPGAFTGLGQELLVVLSGRPAPADRFEPLAPGTPFVRDGAAHIRCGQDAYLFTRVRLGRRAMTGRRLAELLV